jgi:site-specific recombinase XerD
VYFVLKEYLERTKVLRDKTESKLLISYMKPHKAVTKDTISRWIKTVMERSGINISKYGPHTIRAAAVSKAGERGVPKQDILRTAGWSNAGTFQKFYNKTKESDCSFSNAVLKL